MKALWRERKKRGYEEASRTRWSRWKRKWLMASRGRTDLVSEWEGQTALSNVNRFLCQISLRIYNMKTCHIHNTLTRTPALSSVGMQRRILHVWVPAQIKWTLAHTLTDTHKCSYRLLCSSSKPAWSLTVMTSRYVCSSFYTAHRSSKQSISSGGRVCVCAGVYFKISISPHKRHICMVLCACMFLC